VSQLRVSGKRVNSNSNNRKVSKSTIHKMLSNPVYYGDFLWKGQLCEGTHEPIVTKDLWDQAQDVLNSRQNKKSGYKKHKWAFQGLISCGRCGCAMTAEQKKGKYIYYHCTGHKGKCGEPYIREEEIDRQFGSALRSLEFDEEILQWVRTALQESHKDEQTYHSEQINLLQKEYQRFQFRIDAVYEDKLDGKIDSAMFDRMHEKYRNEQIEIRKSIQLHEQANKSYLYDGVRILELARNAYRLYIEQDMSEKRRLLQIVFSNCTWLDGRLTPVYRKPFDLLAKTNVAYQEGVEVSQENRDFRPIWLPGQDSNLQHTG
jgi:site-specific DNA recombinase